jgi:hypothetical protein
MTRRGYPGTVEEWPKQLRALVNDHGAATVHRVGLEALLYPPAWILSTGEAMKVAKALTKEK